MVFREERRSGVVAQTLARQRDGNPRKFQSNLQMTSDLVNRLGLEKELVGHHGCVNCLEWSRDGTTLASASDDLNVILWDPFRYKAKLKLPTGHSGNIFSVKFVSDTLLATCAADFSVRVHDLVRGNRVRDVGELADPPMMLCTCHCGRVKRIATTPDNPYLMWSAGEDGFVLQHDLRTPHTCNSDHPIVLVNLLNHLGRYAEAKCVAINPRRPELIAVGANDFYVRMYDRRMIKLSPLYYTLSQTAQQQLQREHNREPVLLERMNFRCSRAGQGDRDNNIPRECVQFFAPGHLSALPDDSIQKKATTYLTFSADGNELLVNLGSEHVYLFDINGHRRPQLLESYIIEHNHGNKTVPLSTNGYSGKNGSSDKRKNGTSVFNGIDKEYTLPPDVKKIKEIANAHMNRKNYIEALDLYNLAISKCPDCAILYSNRAAALMRRNWIGDMYAAIRDCYIAVKLDPGHVKSHFRIAKALMELQKPREAQECILYLKAKFPKQADSHAVNLLQKDVTDAISQLETIDDEETEEVTMLVSQLEKVARPSATDYTYRFLGHCNTTTDIKEANFLDPAGNFIAAGSDDGAMYIWDRKSGCTARVLLGDDHILNCIQPHPSTCLIATSGIDPVVRLWSPVGEVDEQKAPDRRLITDYAVAASNNQSRMRADPFEAMLLNMTYSPRAPRERDNSGGTGREVATASCRTS